MPSNDTHTATAIIRYLMLLGAVLLAIFMSIEFVDLPGDDSILTSNLWLALDFFLLVVLLLGFFRLRHGRK